MIVSNYSSIITYKEKNTREMDFEKILHVARKNELNKKEPVKCLQTKFKPPTKEQREKDKVLSEGVQRFLARKEEEERQRQREAERRKQELLALRAKDPKANKRIQTMLKRTKSANKSVMEDAIDNNNTADTLAGPSQPDEDDYGFVSETSSQLYNKLIQKMYSIPSDDQPKFAPSKKPVGANLANTKERVKMALLMQEEEDRSPHKRRRKGKEKKEDEEDVQLDYSAPDRDLSNMSTGKGKIDAPKVRKPAPPPMDFRELLKIAEQKQHEPIVFLPKEKKEEPDVLMTKKQKLEYERMQEWKRKRELQNSENHGNTPKDDRTGPKKIPKAKESVSTTPKIPKLNKNKEDSKQSSKASPITKDSKNSTKDANKAGEKMQKVKNHLDRIPKLSENDKKFKALDDETNRLIKERDEALRILKQKERIIKERDEAVRKLKEKERLIRERDEAVRKLKMLERAEKMGKVCVKPKSSGSEVNKSSKPGPATPNGGSAKVSSTNGRVVLSKVPQSDIKDGKLQPKGQRLPSSTKDSDVSVRQFPRNDLKPVKHFPPSDLRRKPHPIKKRRIDSDEDEYDSDLDDFIDDGEPDVNVEDVSKVISEIFHYDKNRYSKYDDDDECMESNFAQISKEEFFSTKCGILEDLQDMKREKEALLRKKKR